MTWELQSTIEASGIRWPAMGKHAQCMAHVIQLALCRFMSNLGVQGHTKSCEANECDQQFGENESTDIGKIQRLRREGNARIHKVSAMRPGLAKIMKKLRLSRHFERSETDLDIARTACCIDYADTWSSKRVPWLATGQCPNSSTTYCGCENTVQFDMAVAWARLPILRIPLLVVWESTIQQLRARVHNTEWMDHCQVRDGSFRAVPILDPVDVEKANSYCASCHHCLQWHGR